QTRKLLAHRNAARRSQLGKRKQLSEQRRSARYGLASHRAWSRCGQLLAVAQRSEWPGAISWDVAGRRPNTLSALWRGSPDRPGILQSTGSVSRHDDSIRNCLAVFVRQPLGHSISKAHAQVRRHWAAQELLPRASKADSVG